METVFKKSYVLVALALLMTVLIGACGGSNGPPSNLTDELSTLAVDFEKFLSANDAVAFGYSPSTECVEAPDLGVMGMHFVNGDLVADPAIDASTPEAMIYQPSSDGFKLVAVEYMLALGAPGADIPADVPPAPVLFGQTFDGPEAAPSVDVPPHYGLHVWLFQENEAGVFEAFNAAGSCS